jgi:type I restriction enzyme S subunit
MTEKTGFYVETNFKKIPELGKVPEEWEVVEIRELFRVETGTTPSTKIPDYWNGEINWYTPLDLSKLNGRVVINDSERKITFKALKEYNLPLLPAGSIILSTRAPVGYVALLESEGTFNQGCKGLIPINRERIYPLFYCYYLSFQRLKLERVSGGSTFKELSKTMLESFKVFLPPVAEQRKIAEILSRVDDAIQKTDEVIANTACLKKGLMQELLTKGIRHNEEFKKVKIAFKECSIPMSWQVKNLLETSIIKGRIGWHGLKAEEYLENGEYYLVRGTEFENGRVVWEKCVYVSKERYEQDPNIQLKEGDILVTKDGSIGKVAFINKLTKKGTLGTGVFVIRPLQNAYLPIYMVYIMQSEFFERFINVLKAGSTLSHLFQKDFMKFEFPLPPIQEQQKIAEILLTVDKKLEIETNKKAILERIKKGLMDLLLTGKIRVKVV